MRTTLLTRPAVSALAVAVVGALSLTVPGAASAAPVPVSVARPAPATAHPFTGLSAFRRAPLPSGEHYVCPAATPGTMECQAIVRTVAGLNPATANVTNGDYGPSQLQAAYKLTGASKSKGKGETVAIVDAFNDGNAASDLAVYRKHFHLKACTTGSGCLKILNEHGKKSPLPKADGGWAIEISLDLDMVSAICPNCKILLVEANSASTADLGTAENTAAKAARFVSNSWSGGEFFGQDESDGDFYHPGDVIDFASGDSGYNLLGYAAPTYPTDLQFVTSVGGTSLKHASNGRGWTESVWGTASDHDFSGTQGGCSALEAKPSWQTADDSEPTGCLNRTENDVSANADPATGVVVYDTYKVPRPLRAGFLEIGGTSEATPIITATYALAGNPARNSFPSEYPYLHKSDLFDVTSGSNGQCESNRKYICNGVPGYDAPTGLGTPNGTGAFTIGSAHVLAVINPGVQDVSASLSFSLRMIALNTKSGAISWSATGLPGTLSINSSSGQITGELPGTPGTYPVTVTAHNGGVTASTSFNIVVTSSLSAPNSTDGETALAASPNLCMDGGNGSSGTAVKVKNCNDSQGQVWSYESEGTPDSTGTFSLGADCLTVGTSAPHATTLSSCTGGATQQWVYLGFGSLWNPKTGGCLNASQSAGSSVTAAGCNFGKTQTWFVPAGQLVTGAGGLCLDNTSGSTVQLQGCGEIDGELWTMEPDGTITDFSNKCLWATSSLSETALTVKACNDQNPLDVFETGPGGELMNFINKCVADQNNGGSGTNAVQNDCYGDAGELWGLN